MYNNMVSNYTSSLKLPTSSKFDNPDDLVKRIRGIPVDHRIRSAELIERGLFTTDLLADNQLIYLNGYYLGGQVVHHFMRFNTTNGFRYPSTIDFQPLSEFLEVSKSDLITAVGKLLNDDVPILERGKISIPLIYDLHQRILGNAAVDGTVSEEVVLKYLPQVKIVAKIIARRLPSHVEFDDMVSVGTLGLIDAIKRYEPSRGLLLETYADVKIRGAILDYLRSLDPLSRCVRRTEKRLVNVTNDLEAKLLRSPTQQELADESGISLERLWKIQTELGYVAHYPSQEFDGELQEVPVIDTSSRADPSYNAIRNEIKRRLIGGIDRLPEKERMVVSLYYYDELTMKEIGKVLGVTEHRISQLHTKAMLRLGKSVRNLNPYSVH